MNKNIEHYVYHKENFLEESYCENSIDELKVGVWQKHKWYNRGTNLRNAPSGDNEPEACYFDSYSKNIKEINNFIVQNLHSTISEYVEIFKFDWFRNSFSGNNIKFIRYFPGHQMQNHCDHIHALFDGERKGVPILSIIGILNDDYEGGEFIMFGDKKINTKKGDLLIFPSNFLYPHEVTPVTRGVRYSYVSWLW